MQFLACAFNEIFPNLHVINLWHKKQNNNNQNNKKQIRFTPPGAAAPGWGHTRCNMRFVWDSAYRPNNYTMPGCGSVFAEPGRSWWEGNNEFFYLLPPPYIRAATFFAPQFKVWFRGKRPECNERYNWYLETDLMHQTALPKVHDLLAFEVHSQPPYCAHRIIIHSLH